MPFGKPGYSHIFLKRMVRFCCDQVIKHVHFADHAPIFSTTFFQYINDGNRWKCENLKSMFHRKRLDRALLANPPH